VTNDQAAEIRPGYEDYSAKELQKACQTIFLYTAEYSGADLAEREEILAVLHRKDPVPRKYTAAGSRKLFQETYSEELSRRGVRDTKEPIRKELPEDPERSPSPAGIEPGSAIGTPRRTGPKAAAPPFPSMPPAPWAAAPSLIPPDALRKGDCTYAR
jgi:hypothetical protein